MTQTLTKQKKLWGKPRVFMSATDLIIEERYYALAQTRGAYVELVPPEKEAPKPIAPAADTRSSFGKTLKIIGGVILLIFVLLFIAWWNDDSNSYGGGGTSRKYRLVLINDQQGPVVVLEHANQKKLGEIANQVNQGLISKGLTPQTGYANAVTTL